MTKIEDVTYAGVWVSPNGKGHPFGIVRNPSCVSEGLEGTFIDEFGSAKIEGILRLAIVSFAVTPEFKHGAEEPTERCPIGHSTNNIFYFGEMQKCSREREFFWLQDGHAYAGYYEIGESEIGGRFRLQPANNMREELLTELASYFEKLRTPVQTS